MATHVDEHLLIYEPNQTQRAHDLLLWQDKSKPRLSAFVKALAKAAQLHENTVWAVLIGATTLQGAEGVTLDRWGELVGEFRGGLTNELYRRFIELRMRVNAEYPAEDMLWEVVSEATRPSTVRLYPLVPGGMQVQVDRTDFLSDTVYAHTLGLVRDLRPVGIIVPVIESIPSYFAFDWDPTATPMGSLAVPGTGVLSRLIYSGRGQK